MVFYSMGVWKMPMLKDTLVWWLTVGFAGVVRFNQQSFRDIAQHLLRQQTSLLVLFEYLTSKYTLSLWAELLFIPILFLVAYLYQMSLIYPAYRISVKPLGRILTGLIVGSLIFSLYKALADFNSILSIESLRSIVWPIVLTTVALPAFFLIQIFAVFGQVFFFLRSYDHWTFWEKMVIRGEILYRLRFNPERATVFLKRFNKVWYQFTTFQEVHQFLLEQTIDMRCKDRQA